jgi:hypothetical protein
MPDEQMPSPSKPKIEFGDCRGIEEIALLESF